MNNATRILESLGLPVAPIMKQAYGDRNASATKSGPGRYHSAGHTKTSPVASKGAPQGFALHQADAAKRQRRNAIEQAGGIRQFNRVMYHKHAGYAGRHPAIAAGVIARAAA